MRYALATAIIVASLSSPAAAKTLEEIFPDASKFSDEEKAFFKDFDFQQGIVKLPAAKASLNVPSNFYYLSPADTKKVLVDVWGNPATAAGDTLGMIFPTKYLPSEGASWGSVIGYDADGYVSDADAATIDYDELLQQIKSGISENNVEREKQGFEPITLIGWASPPRYDQPVHALHWARDLVFGKNMSAAHTLNYSIRILGREGVLQFNFVASLDQLAEIREAIPSATKMASFDKGAGYTDFQSGDAIAAYGMAGMIAAGAGAKVAAKFGLFAIILALLKKGGFFVVIAAIAGGYKALTGLFKRNKTPSA
ncbi:DUF2167 domain-containing protein [Rhizobium sp. XQZ8]|uniref:DUF2167 domain-containing protein n=1 Tax=Rhizobium populisoli TaxID=2859785 RepID=UPI001C680BCE|nr:DUF2167 domain-containing protein [Rhizobium populisoli]MBW6420328.1 DUF2167 domain-containing protein [Rhizobium populisoli]